jgi:hypothetical protein
MGGALEQAIPPFWEDTALREGRGEAELAAEPDPYVNSQPRRSPIEQQIEEDINNFATALRGERSKDTVMEVTRSLAASMSYNLSLSTIPNQLLDAVLKTVPKTISSTSVDKDTKASALLLYWTSLWNGITGSKILKPEDYGIPLLRGILGGLTKLPLSASASLVLEVLRGVPKTFHEELEKPVSNLAQSFMKELEASTSETSNGETSPISALDYDTRWKLASRLTYMTRRLSPALYQDLVLSVLSTFPRSQTLGTTASRHRHFIHDLLRHNMTESQLIRMARVAFIGDAKGASVVSSDIVDYALRLWIRREQRARFAVNRLKDPKKWHTHNKRCEELKELERFFTQQKDNASREPRDIILDVLAFMAARPRAWKTEERFLLRAYREVYGPRAFVQLLCADRKGGEARGRVVLSRDLLRESVAELHAKDPKAALRLLASHAKSIRIEDVPELEKTVLEAGTVDPDFVWLVLGVRHQEWNHKVWQDTGKPSPQRVELIKKLAVRFAKDSTLSRRVAFRNLQRCHTYLSYHRIPIPEEIVAALVDVGIKWHVLHKGRAPRGRMEWILKLVSKTFGEDMARRIEHAVCTMEAEPTQVLRLKTVKRISKAKSVKKYESVGRGRERLETDTF